MGKSSIELTLKQLIDLGIINLKKRKRKRKGKRVKQYLPNNIKSDSSGMVGYSTPVTDASKSFYQNTDALRLRDAQEDLRIKQLEFKNIAQERFDKQIKFEEDANQFLDQYYQNLPRRQQPEVPKQQRGFTEDDGLGIMGPSTPDDMFVPQINRQEATPQEKDIQIRYLTKEQTKQAKQAQVKFTDIDEEGVFGPLPENVVAEEPVLKQGGRELPDPVLRNVQGLRLPEVILQQAPTQSPKSILKGRPSKEEIKYYQSWYETLKGEDADDKILNSNKKSEIEKELIKILLPIYKSKGGNNSIILKSKNAELIRDAIDDL